MDKTELLYGKRSFSRLRDNGCFLVYEIHIDMLEETLTEAKNADDYNRCKQIEDAKKFFETLKKQARRQDD